LSSFITFLSFPRFYLAEWKSVRLNRSWDEEGKVKESELCGLQVEQASQLQATCEQ
jgi:hypothetical protein